MSTIISSSKYAHGRDKLIAIYPALFYSKRFNRTTYDFSKPWTWGTGITEEQFISAKNNPELLQKYFPYKEISNRNASCGFNYLKGDVYLDYNDYAGFFLRCKTSSGVEVTTDPTKGEFLLAVDFRLKWSQGDLDIPNSSIGLYSYSDIYNDQRSLWLRDVNANSACNRADFVYKESGLSEVNGFGSPTVYSFNLDNTPSPNDKTLYNGLYTESESKGYKEVLFNFENPRTLKELSNRSDDELINKGIEDITFTKDVVSLKFSRNPYNKTPNEIQTPTLISEVSKEAQDNYYEKAKRKQYVVTTGTGSMFNISVPNGYYINAIFFSSGLGLGHALMVNGKDILNNQTSNGIVNDTSLPICPIEKSETIWKPNRSKLTSVDFSDLATSGGRHEVSVIWVSYGKVGEILKSPTTNSIEIGHIGSNTTEGNLNGLPLTDDGKKAKAVDLGLSVKWADCNIGAQNKYYAGAAFQWGSTVNYLYDKEHYRWYNKNTDKFEIPTENISYTNVDVATKKWGGTWRMPTETEINELVEKCKWTKTDNGFYVEGPNGNTIYLPFTTLYYGEEYTSGKLYYWSGTYNNLPLHEDDHWAYYLTNYTSNGDSEPTVISSYVCNGLSIRPVCGGDLEYNPNISETDINEDSGDYSDTGNPYLDKSRKEIMSTVALALKSNMYRQKVFDFSKPWEIFPSKSQSEFTAHKYDDNWLSLYANLKDITLSGDVNINYNKGLAYEDWTDNMESFYALYTPGSGFSVNSDIYNGYVLKAIDFGAKMTLVDLKVESGCYGDSGHTFYTSTNPMVNGANFRFGTEESYILYRNGLLTPKLYYYSLDDIPYDNDPALQFIYDEIETKGYKQAMFNFVRPQTLSIFSTVYPENYAKVDLYRKAITSKDVTLYIDADQDHPGDDQDYPGGGGNNPQNAPQLLESKGPNDIYAKTKDPHEYALCLGNHNKLTISVPSGYAIKCLAFWTRYHGIALMVNGKLYEESGITTNNHSLPIYSIDTYEDLFKTDKEDLTSIDFGCVSNVDTSAREITALTVGYIKIGETITSPSKPSIDDTDYNINDNPLGNDSRDDNYDGDDNSGSDNPISKDALVFTDTGDTGYSVDPNVILYAGGQEVIPKTMAQKDNTLFLGNYKESSRVFSQEMADFIKANSKVEFTLDMVPNIPKGETGSLYMYENQLNKNSYDIASFKGGEAYRFGVVFQNRRGEWSDVVYVGDYVNDKYPDDKGTYFYAPRARISLTPKATEKLYGMGYRKVKPVVVYPSVNNRLAVCQGVLCPTVYNINQRNNNSPYAMSSWFYREMHSKLWQNTGTQNKHNYNIYNDINDYVKASNRVISTIGGHFGNGRN